MGIKKAVNCLLEALRYHILLARHNAAQAALVLPQTFPVKRSISFNARHSWRTRLANGSQSAIITVAVTLNERSSEILLRRKMMVDARLANADSLRQIGVAEPRVAAFPDQPLRLGDQTGAHSVRYRASP